MNRRRVGQTFLSAGLGDFLVARWTAGLESPANRQAGKPALVRLRASVQWRVEVPLWRSLTPVTESNCVTAR
jgi:hypothetical protein